MSVLYYSSFDIPSERECFYVENKAVLPDTPDLKKVLSYYHFMKVSYDVDSNTLEVALTMSVSDKVETIKFIDVLADKSVFHRAGLPDKMVSSIINHLNKIIVGIESVRSVRSVPMHMSWYPEYLGCSSMSIGCVASEIVAIDRSTYDIVKSNVSNSEDDIYCDLIPELIRRIDIKELSDNMKLELEYMKDTRKKIHRLLKDVAREDRYDEYHETMEKAFHTLSYNRYKSINNCTISYRHPIENVFNYSSMIRYKIGTNRKVKKNIDEYEADTAFSTAEVFTYHNMKYDSSIGSCSSMRTYIELVRAFGRYAFRAVDYVEAIISEALSSKDDSFNLESESSIMSKRFVLMKCMIIYTPTKWLRKGRYNEVKGYVMFMYPVISHSLLSVIQETEYIPSKVRRICAYESGQTYAIVNKLIEDHPHSEMILSRHAWMTYFGRIPKNKVIRDLGEVNIMLLKITNSFKYFMKFIKQLNITESDDHLVLSLSNLCICFGSRVFDIIPLDSSKVRIHNAGVDIVPSRAYTDKEIQWFINSLKIIRSDTDLSDIRSKDLHKILQTYITFGVSLNAPLRKVMQELLANKYTNVKNIHFASECAKHGISEGDYVSYQDKYLKFKTCESLPQIIIEEGDYKFFKLDYDDPRGLFLGEYTDCCQHIEGAGSSCAWYGHHNGESAFYVVTKKDKIVAQSWAWRNDNVVVFDSIEYLVKTKPTSLFKKAAKMMLGKLMISAVKAGMGSGVFSEGDYDSCISSNTPSGIYTDAKSQHMLASTEDFVDTDKSSSRFDDLLESYAHSN